MTEVWKPIPGEEHYEVSNLGRVKSLRRNLILRPYAANTYRKVRLSNRREYVHRLVAEAFLGGIPKGMEVNHIDFDKTNNRLENLEIVTRSQNIRHSVKAFSRPRNRKTNTGERYISKVGNRYRVGMKNHKVAYRKNFEEAKLLRDLWSYEKYYSKFV